MKKRIIYLSSFILIILGIGIFIDQVFFKPTVINSFIATKIYSSPANNYFTDENFYKCVVDAYNKENSTSLPYTTSLSDSQLGSIKKLVCYGYWKSDEEKIINTSGLEKLTSLTSLNVGSNQLTSIDVSKNTSLTSLTVDNNQLTSLDVSKNIKLEQFSASSNQLTELDISKNTVLTQLGIDDNQLVSLDVSKNTMLTALYARKNQITSLDVSKNTAITGLYVSENQLTSLDVSNNTALIWLHVYENQLTSLNIIKNISLFDLRAFKNQLTGLDVSNNTSLTSLDVFDNQLTSLDVSKNVALKELIASGNQLTELNINNNTSLTRLDIDDNQLIEIDISKNTALTSLTVDNNQLTSLDVSKNIKLEQFSASSNQLTELDVSNNTSLTSLDVFDNQLTSLDASKNSLLTYLRVYGNPFATNIIIYKGSINTDGDNRFVKLPEGKTSTLTSLKSNNSVVNIDGNNININKIGEYVATADYKHDIQSNFNTYSGTYNIKVIEITSDKYMINEEDSYIYTSTDIDNDTILSNINLDSECTKVIENNELVIKYNDEVLKKFKIINISSTKYDLSKEYIYDNSFNKDNINVINGTSEVVDNELLIKYNDDVLERYKIVSISSTKYDLSKEYIYDNNFNKDNINITNGTSEIVNNELLIKYNNDVLERYKIVSISSTKYDLSKEYIYIGTGDIDLDSIKVVNGTIELVDNELILKYGEEVLDRYKIIGIKFGNLKVNMNLVVITKNITYDVFISNITTNGVTYKIFNGEEEVTSGNISKGMVVKVYYKEEVVYTYNITDEYLGFIEPLEVVEETKRIYKVKLNTSVNDLLSKINTSGTITIKKDDKIITDNTLVGTGTKVIIELSSGTKEYTLVIKGDVTGTGKSSVSDVAKLYQYLKKKITMEDYFIEAGNVVNTDNEIRINDVAKLYQFIKGKLNSLE